MTQAVNTAQLASSGGLYTDTSGNVGIGTTSPTDGLLQLNGGTSTNIKFTNATTGTTGSDGFYVGLGTSNDAVGYIYQRENSSINFGTNNTERFRIGESGQFGIAGANYGSAGQVFTSNGAGSAPSWQTVSSAPTTAQVLNATAGASLGAVGTYALLRTGGTATFNQGSTYAGSGLQYAGTNGASGSNGTAASPTPAGTWLAVGYSSGSAALTAFLRIS